MLLCSEGRIEEVSNPRFARARPGAESYEELESRGQRIRQILDSTDSFHSDTPTSALNRGEAGGGRKGIGGGAFSSAISQEGRVMVAFTLKEVCERTDKLSHTSEHRHV